MRTPLAIVSLAAALLGASLLWPAGAADAPAAASAPATAAPASPAATAAPASPAATAAATGPTDTGILGSPEQRARYHRLAEELRCLVCQNQTLADSNAELAADLRHQVENQILAGRSDDEIKAYLVQRYGDFVLYRPPMKSSTWLLWLGPFALLLSGGLVWWRVQRRSRAAQAADAARAAAQGTDLERARRLLGEQ
ncbi:MAG: hypothetical protein BroJett031_23310 [Betaproteobacteria bacterium]|nr:MAG: hypothetical protein BroJett031_23310 [Betaproteobacteria bacterium]